MILTNFDRGIYFFATIYVTRHHEQNSDPLVVHCEKYFQTKIGDFSSHFIFGSGAAESPISHLGRTRPPTPPCVKSILKLPRLVDTKNAVL